MLVNGLVLLLILWPWGYWWSECLCCVIPTLVCLHVILLVWLCLSLYAIQMLGVRRFKEIFSCVLFCFASEEINTSFLYKLEPSQIFFNKNIFLCWSKASSWVMKVRRRAFYFNSVTNRRKETCVDGVFHLLSYLWIPSVSQHQILPLIPEELLFSHFIHY